MGPITQRNNSETQQLRIRPPMKIRAQLDAKTTLFIVNSELSQSLDNWYFSSSSVSGERLFLDETRRDEPRRDEVRQGETERWSALKGKSFKLRERKKNAFLLIPDKYVGKRAAESAALCLRSNGFVKLCWYAANARSEKHVRTRRTEGDGTDGAGGEERKRRLPGCFGNFELLRFTGPKKQSGVLRAQLFHRRPRRDPCATMDTLESATFFLWRFAAISSVVSTAAAVELQQVRNFGATVYRYSYTHVIPAKQNHAARFPMDLKAVDDKSRVKILSKIEARFIIIRSYIRREGGRRLGAEGRLLARIYSLHTAHSLKDNYSFAIDLKISEILASVEPFPVEKYRRRGAGAGVGEKVPRKSDASGCGRKAGREPGGRRKERGREGRVPK
ncbi:hypothetical protein G5I_03000 [Acromyrmex echinatior]|uniref:Uncharacterized protein n=1 Tax=Acromyrmex echinatior TaxID=103372 RepID=F4WBS9_ACREC|nr:hypothetical protein G5I_03000 [Acromyrmex echinatior]